MKNKNLIYIIAAIGIGYWLYNRNKTKKNTIENAIDKPEKIELTFVPVYETENEKIQKLYQD